MAKGTWLGALDLSHFIPPPLRIDEKNCKVHNEFPTALQKPVEDLVDAFLYLGPQDLRLKEKIPADIALDTSYRAQFQGGADMLGFPDAASETSAEFDQQIVKSAEAPLFSIPKQLDPKLTQRAVQDCLDRQKGHGDASGSLVSHRRPRTARAEDFCASLIYARSTPKWWTRGRLGRTSIWWLVGNPETRRQRVEW